MNKTTTERGAQMSESTQYVSIGRNEAIKRIKLALRQRSGKTWSVTGGCGTAWGWITIDAVPSKKTAHWRLKSNAITTSPSEYEEINNGLPNGHTPLVDRNELAQMLGLDSVHCQGVSIPASSDYYKEYIDRAENRKPSVCGVQYWD